MKNKIIATLILLVFTIAFLILLILYINNNKENKEMYMKEKITISVGDKSTEYTFNELLELIPAVDFEATYKPNNKEPVKKTYTGIELRLLIEALGIKLEDINKITFIAGDGFQKLYTIDDVKKENNVYITYKVNGKLFNKGIEALAYTKEQEDGGPYVVIKASDKVSQNRVKMLARIKIE